MLQKIRKLIEKPANSKEAITSEILNCKEIIQNMCIWLNNIRNPSESHNNKNSIMIKIQKNPHNAADIIVRVMKEIK